MQAHFNRGPRRSPGAPLSRVRLSRHCGTWSPRAFAFLLEAQTAMTQKSPAPRHLGRSLESWSTCRIAANCSQSADARCRRRTEKSSNVSGGERVDTTQHVSRAEPPQRWVGLMGTCAQLEQPFSLDCPVPPVTYLLFCCDYGRRDERSHIKVGQILFKGLFYSESCPTFALSH